MLLGLSRFRTNMSHKDRELLWTLDQWGSCCSSHARNSSRFLSCNIGRCILHKSKIGIIKAKKSTRRSFWTSNSTFFFRLRIVLLSSTLCANFSSTSPTSTWNGPKLSCLVRLFFAFPNWKKWNPDGVPNPIGFCVMKRLKKPLKFCKKCYNSFCLKYMFFLEFSLSWFWSRG